MPQMYNQFPKTLIHKGLKLEKGMNITNVNL